MMRFRRLIIACCLFFGVLGSFSAHAAPDSSRYDVFLRGQTVIFADARTALGAIVNANGDWHTLIGGGVLFRAADTQAALVALPNGDVVLHPYIPRQTDATITYWVASANGQWLAWAFTTRSERGTVSDLFVVEGLIGENSMVLHTTSTLGLGVLPLAISDDGAYVFYTRRTDLFEALPSALELPVEGVFRLHTATLEAAALPDSPDCPCVMAFSPDARRALRLAETTDGVTLSLIEVNGGVQQGIAVLRGYERASYPIFAADGKKALLSLSRSSGRTRFALALADFTAREARLLTESPPEALRAVALTARADTALLTSLTAAGTFKLILADGALARVSTDSYLGTLP